LSASLERRLKETLVGKDACWTDPFYSLKFGHGVRSLVWTGGDQSVRLFSAGLCNELRDNCCRIVIRHRSSLLQCMQEAESGENDDTRSWVVVR